MTIILEKSNFVLTNIILSQNAPFTFEEVFKEALSADVHIDPSSLSNMLNNLVDAGLVNDYGTNYALSSIMTR